MPRNRRRDRHLTLAGPVVVAAGSLAAWVAAGCTGGCPWTEQGEPTLSPASACLSVRAHDQMGSPGGCVNPVIAGRNDCTETLSFSSEWSARGEQVIASPGSDFELEVPLDKATNADAAASGEADRWEYSVSGMLGTTAILISFHTE